MIKEGTGDVSSPPPLCWQETPSRSVDSIVVNALPSHARPSRPPLPPRQATSISRILQCYRAPVISCPAKDKDRGAIGRDRESSDERPTTALGTLAPRFREAVKRALSYAVSGGGGGGGGGMHLLSIRQQCGLPLIRELAQVRDEWSRCECDYNTRVASLWGSTSNLLYRNWRRRGGSRCARRSTRRCRSAKVAPQHRAMHSSSPSRLRTWRLFG